MTKKISEMTLEELTQDAIETDAKGGGFSHNIVRLILTEIKGRYGLEAAQAVYDQLVNY